MIPQTFPSRLGSDNVPQMVCHQLTDVTGLQRWIDFIPVKFITSTEDKRNTYANDGYIDITNIESIVGKQSWLDYIPIYEDVSATKAWSADNDGFIPLISQDVSSVFVTYLDIRDSAASPELMFFASDSVDSGNNTGWIFE